MGGEISTALAALVWLGSIHGAFCQNQGSIFASVAFVRIGEPTPSLGNSFQHLTSFGANQMYNLGAFLRTRYVGMGPTSAPGSNQIVNISTWAIQSAQLSILTLDEQSAVVSAQALMQSFYPKYLLTNTTATYLDPSAITASNSYLDYPGGYQYPYVETADDNDPESVFITGTDNCINFEIEASFWYRSSTFLKIFNASLELYQTLGTAMNNENFPLTSWSFYNGFNIYNYVNYLDNHDSWTYSRLNGEFSGYLPELANLAGIKMWSLLGNTSVSGAIPGDRILTIAGQTLAAKIVGLMDLNVGTGGLLNKFNLMVGDYQPMISLLSLLGLEGSFDTVPAYGSALIFELFSPDVNATVMDTSKLWVRFIFRDGSNPTSSNDSHVNPPGTVYPIFGRDSTVLSLSWSDFREAMAGIMLGDVSNWCAICASDSVFCAAFEGGSSSGSSRKHGVSAPVAGVIGAIVTLAILGLAALIAFFLCGVGFRRQESRKSELGGFKGSAKLASDVDLHIPKNAAPIGVSVDEGKRTHERVGSWELKPAEDGNVAPQHGRYVSMGSTIVDRPSFEGDELGDAFHSSPVKPVESV